MSLIVGIRAAQGLVLATDSMTRRDDAAFFTARKLFKFPSQPHVAAAVCGTLSLGRGELRSVSVLMDAFAEQLRIAGGQRLSTFQVAQQLGAYLTAEWQEHMLPEDDDDLDVIVAGYDPGFPYGEFYVVEIPRNPEPRVYRVGQQSFFVAYWGHTTGVRSIVEPYTFPFDIMPLVDCAALASHLITSTARLETWSSKRQRIGGPVKAVTITQADGAQWSNGG
jgi:hypothetical protein